MQAFSYITNVIPVQVTYGGTTATGFVDTGNPFIELDPTVFTSAASLSSNGQDVPSLVVGGSTTVTNAYVIPTNEGLSSPDPAFPLAANLGCAGICGFVATFNYRDVVFGLGSTAGTPPSDLAAETVLPFSFEGGSVDDGITVPRSRIVVTVSLEGNNYEMILDSGASTVALSAAAYNTLTADGRAQVSGGSVETTSGVSTSMLSRAKSITVGGVEVDSVVVTYDPSFASTQLAAISTDVGRTIDGSLGGTYLHDFYVTVDYAASQVHLARYQDLSFAVDPAEQIGLSLEASDGGYAVAAVSAAAAAQGVSVNDVVTAINGVQIADLAAAQIAVLEHGAVGASKQVVFGSAATLAGQTVSMVVEEQLPLSQ